jgi:hypothetical protein
MRPTYLTFVIAAAALVGCSDAPSPTQIDLGAKTPTLRPTTVSGTVAPNTNGHKGAALMLLQADGTTIGLTGDQAASLYSVVGDDVEVEGLLDETSEMFVEGFLVVAVGGERVFDGVLDQTPDGFILHLTNGGDRGVIDPSDELQQHLGDRVWLAGSEDSAPTAFGVITVATHDTDLLHDSKAPKARRLDAYRAAR